MSEGFRLSITYEIRGRLAYLSHLETVEAMRRIVRRAQLPYAVSEGFSPHMKATFGPALPVGASGLDERFDVRLRDYVPATEALERLQQAAPQHLMPVACRYVDVSAPAPDVALALSFWRAQFAGGDDARECESALQAAFDELLSVGFVEIVKRKRGKETRKRIMFDEKLACPPAFSLEDGSVCMEFATRQGPDGALRPDTFIDAGLAGCAQPPQLVSLVRTRLAEQ